MTGAARSEGCQEEHGPVAIRYFTGADWAAADRIRDALAAAGVVVEDGADGATWRLAD